MNITKTIIGVSAILVAISMYGVLIWFGLHSDALSVHEKEIDALQGELLETVKVNKILQQGLLEDIQELEDRIASSEDDTRSLVADTDRSLRETVEWTEQNLGVSIRDEVDAIHREIADLSGLVADTRLTLQQTQTDVDFLAVATAEEVEVLSPPEITLPVVSIPPPALVINLEEIDETPQANLYREYTPPQCPKSPNNANKARRILTRAMEKTADTGSYSFGATFNINSEGATDDVVVNGNGPSDLRKAVARYAAALEWTVDERVNDCELKLKLDIE